MQTGVKVGIGVGALAGTAATTAAWVKVAYGDAVANRNNDRNALINMGQWFGTIGLGVASGIAFKRSSSMRPAAMLGAAAGAMGVLAYAGAAALEKGWTTSGIAYCNYGICNVASREYGGKVFYVGDNPLDGADIPPERRAAEDR